MNPELDRREFLASSAAAVACAIGMPGLGSCPKSLRDMTDEQKLALLEQQLAGQDLKTTMFDSIVRTQVRMIRDASLPIPKRMGQLRALLYESRSLSEVQLPYLRAAHEKFGAKSLLSGTDPLVADDGPLHRCWRERVEQPGREADYYLKCQIIARMIHDVLLHKEKQAEKPSCTGTTA